MEALLLSLLLIVLAVMAACTIRAMSRSPLGYEDDNGFHFGSRAAEDDEAGSRRSGRKARRRPVPHHDSRHAA
ncbi:MAG TPA: hypothetical protein VEB66_05155 [Opitutaceae bacterium]|nr:hypothetical protein [Opitutaceae bacterium]